MILKTKKNIFAKFRDEIETRSRYFTRRNIFRGIQINQVIYIFEKMKLSFFFKLNIF